MSLWARILIALVSGLFGLFMLFAALTIDGNRFFYFLFGIFCLSISVASLAPRRIAQFFGCIVASGILVSGIWYMGSMLMEDPLDSGRRGVPSVLSALMFLVAFGLPGALYIWRTRFGFGEVAKPLKEWFAVEFDDTEVRFRVLNQPEHALNQSFKWSDITRVCFQDRGLYHSDLLLIRLAGHEKLVVIPTEIEGGSKLFDALCERQLFPDDVWRKAIAETGGRTHCWPPLDTSSAS